MDELLDVVNDEDIVVSQAMRSTVHQQGLQHRGVHVFLFTQEGRLLIQKRSKDRASFPSAWDCSISEHVKAGESTYDAAARGLKEELGLMGVKIKPVAKFKMNYGPNDNEISTMYRGLVEPTMVSVDPVEIETIDYVDHTELQKLMTDAKETFCGWFIQMIRWSEGKDSDLQILRTYSIDPLLWTQKSLQNGPQS